LLPKSTSVQYLAPDDRRVERRFVAAGDVLFRFPDPLPCNVTGQLVDCSRSGFRAYHNYPALVSGQLVSFRHSQAEGKAQVVWNRILGEHVETGFVVLTAIRLDINASENPVE
jgi:hypothetical protein